MDDAGLQAFRTVRERHMTRESYREMAGTVSDAQRRHKVRLRVDAAHFLAVNLETMVLEPLAERMGSVETALADPDLQVAVADTLSALLTDMQADPVATPLGSDPMALDPGAGVSAGRVLEVTGERYRSLPVSSWRLWGD